MSSSETQQVGVVVERRKLNNPWQQWSWRAVALAPAIEQAQPWQVLNRSEGWVRYFAGILPILLHRTETASYRDNLGGAEPQVYVVLRADKTNDEFPCRLYLATVAPDGLKIAVAQKDDLVIAGIGVAFVRAVLDTTPGAALADQPGYRDAIGRVGGSNNVQLYVDVAAVMDIAGRHLPADATAAFNANTKPYLAPLRALAVAGAAGDPNRVRLIVTVK